MTNHQRMFTYSKNDFYFDIDFYCDWPQFTTNKKLLIAIRKEIGFLMWVRQSVRNGRFIFELSEYFSKRSFYSNGVAFFLFIWWFRMTVFLFLPRWFTRSSTLYTPYLWRSRHSDRIQSPFIPLFSNYIYWIMQQIELRFLVTSFFFELAQAYLLSILLISHTMLQFV